MRVSREKAAEHRDGIVDVAARLFRERGFDGVGIDTIMQHAGLTHGGFYGHFRSKEDLAAAAVMRALQQSAERQGRFPSLDELVGDYLTEQHCADRANGCAIAALGADITRQAEGTRHVLTKHVRAQLDRFARLIRGGTVVSRRKRAIATLAGLVGAMTLARAVNDLKLSKEILNATREVFGSGKPARSKRERH